MVDASPPGQSRAPAGSSGGGGLLDARTLALIALIAGWRYRRRLGTRTSPAVT